MKTLLLIALSTLISQLSTARAQLVLNGSFESPTLSSTQNITGSFNLGAWNGFAESTGGNAGLVFGTDSGLAPADGTQHFTFNGGNNSPGGWIQQTLTTTPGTAYTLTFAIGRSGQTGYDLQLRTTATDTATSTSLLNTLTAPSGGIGYTSVTLSFIASGTSTRLRFTDASTNNLNSDLYLDNVSLSSAIPEPSTYALLAGLAVLALAAHRKRPLPPSRPPSPTSL